MQLLLRNIDLKKSKSNHFFSIALGLRNIPLVGFGGYISGSILRDHVRCLGSETSLFNCLHKKFSSSHCHHREDSCVVSKYRLYSFLFFIFRRLSSARYDCLLSVTVSRRDENLFSTSKALKYLGIARDTFTLRTNMCFSLEQIKNMTEDVVKQTLKER